ncbi:MAG: DUF4135 domain-containing protein, partial [Ktedonobacteraceae bacterium]
MDLEQLRQLFKALNVTFEDDFTLKRAILYYDFVQRTYASLTTGRIKQELSRIRDGFQRVEPALTKPGLLTDLCNILDEYLVSAVNTDLQQSKATYGQYFESLFKDYPNSVVSFLKKYPNTAQALTKINTYFEQNIFTACERILNDWSYLQGTFVDQKDSFLDQLTDIHSTGSDFHKGGQQVLLLTFSTKPARTEPARPPVRIVYKPSDLEVDCLIIGNTQAVNNFRPNFQQASLMEILNGLIKTSANQVLMQFPTYKILPIYPGSQLQRDTAGRLPLRNSYGYIQFLEYDGISPSLEVDGTCLRYYTLLGQLAAIACTFSLS